MWLHYSLSKAFFLSLSIENMQSKNNILQCSLPPRCQQIISWWYQEGRRRGMSFAIAKLKRMCVYHSCKTVAQSCFETESKISRVIISLSLAVLSSGYFPCAFLQPCFSRSSCHVAIYIQFSYFSGPNLVSADWTNLTYFHSFFVLRVC